jgi:hypothetical protein
LALAAGWPMASEGAELPHAGFLVDEFDLTLAPGHRMEAVGPLFYRQQQEGQHTWAVPPLLSYTRAPAVPLVEFDFLYPLLTYDLYGAQHRWQLLQLLSFSGGPSSDESVKQRFTLFPLYFQQRSSNPDQNYTAVVPFYGHLKHRLFRDDIFFVMFPLYGQSRKRDVVTDNYLYPFFHLRHGTGLKGWQFWPLVGNEHKDVTTRTNGFNEIETVAGHDKFFALWPFFFNDHTGLGTTNPVWQQTSFLIYGLERSPQRDSTSVLCPFFSHITDREKKYREWDAPWPLVEFARGEGKTTTRVWPFFSRAHTATLEDNFYLWPIYKHDHARLKPLDRDRKRILFFLYSDIHDKNTETGASRRRIDFWPFLLQRREFNGNTRVQVFAPLETFVAGSHKIPRDYSPLWSVWRAEKNAQTAAASQSLLWNLYRRETSPERKRVSIFFGLYQYQADASGRRTRWFYLLTSASRNSARSPAVK